MNSEFLILWKLTASNTVTIIFDYKLCTAMEDSNHQESNRIADAWNIPRQCIQVLGNSQRALECSITPPSGRHIESSDGIGIFPAFYSIDRHPTIHQFLAEYFDKDQSYYIFTDAGKVCALSIYLFDACDLPSIQVLTKNMTMTFPKIDTFNFPLWESMWNREFPVDPWSYLNFWAFELKNICVISAFTGDEKKLSLYSAICMCCTLNSGPPGIKEMERFLTTLRWLMWKTGNLHALYFV